MRAIVTIGAPGCGKSTLAANHPEWVEINRDAARLELTGAVDDHSREGDVTAIYYNRIAMAAREGRDVIVSDTNITKVFRVALVAHLKAHGFRVVAVNMWLSLVDLMKRNDARDKPVPAEVIWHFYKAMIDPENGVSLADGFDGICSDPYSLEAFELSRK